MSTSISRSIYATNVLYAFEFLYLIHFGKVQLMSRHKLLTTCIYRMSYAGACITSKTQTLIFCNVWTRIGWRFLIYWDAINRKSRKNSAIRSGKSLVDIWCPIGSETKIIKMTSEANEDVVNSIFNYWIDCVCQFFFSILGVVMNLIIILIISSKK